MPATKRPKPLYQRGDFKLYPGREGRAHEIVWYDRERRRERSASANTRDEVTGRQALDRLYLESGGHRHCDACGRPFEGLEAPLLLIAIKDYLLLSEHKAGYKATKGRLMHVSEYVALTDPTVTCADIDVRWVDAFRKWMAARPVAQQGQARQRSLGHIEGCVLQLAAAINATPGQQAQFKAEQMKAVAASPTHRSDVAEIAAMFRYCLDPQGKWIRSEKERDVYRGYRANLLRYLRVAVATWARPEEIFDLGKGQWTPAARVLDLNPPGRRQTKKYRGRIPIAQQFTPFLDDLDDSYMPVTTIWGMWCKMRRELGLPPARESGIKLIRRSMATIVRLRIGEEHWRQGQMMLGHIKSSISDVYAIPDPANYGLALAATEAIIDEIERLAPGAYRAVTAQAPALSIVAGGKNG